MNDLKTATTASVVIRRSDADRTRE